MRLVLLEYKDVLYVLLHNINEMLTIFRLDVAPLDLFDRLWWGVDLVPPPKVVIDE